MAVQMQDGRPQDDGPESLEEEVPVAKKKGPPIFIIVGLVILIALLGIAAKMFWGKFHKHGKPAPVVEKVGEMVPMDEFMMNLADPGGDHYIKMTLVLGLKQGVSGDKFKDDIPQCRDAIVMVLSAKKLADINTVPGKIELKQEIKDAVNQSLHEREVVDVFYQAFATQ